VVLGYGDPDINEAIRRQLDNGISFSLATELEAELSELLCKHIPCAEMVKLGTSGTDETTAAVRLARAYTDRSHVLHSGYHGWADWSIGKTLRHHGVPDSIKSLTHPIAYGKKLDWWHDPEMIHDTAAIIVEPNDDPEYLKWLREFCTRHGIILIFDEIITGFRYDIGGAQKLYGVTPDLACFGKAMGNGMPISALVGSRKIMKLMETPDVFYSGTMFGETLSIAAAITTINKIERENVIPHLYKNGQWLQKEIESLIEIYNLQDVISVTGNPTRTAVNFKDHPNGTANEIRTLFMMEMIQQGVLIIASNNMSFAHKQPEMKRIRKAYEETLLWIHDCLESNNIREFVSKENVVEATPLRATA
jgi:glutamate-1-semialdehyde 2,1-aminomutase/spore coat polysaccharide biosynthesis protein SpsF